MSWRVAKRVLLAPVVIVTATTVIPPSAAMFSPASKWFAETPAPSAATFSPLSTWLAENLPRPNGDTVFASLSGWVASSAAIFSQIGGGIETINAPARVTVSVASDLFTDEPQLKDPSGIVSAEVPEQKAIYASLSPPRKAQAANVSSLVPERKGLSAEVPAAKPVYASLDLTAVVSDVRPGPADPLPVEETKIASIKPEATKAEDKPIHASLSSPAEVNDPQIKPEPLPAQETSIPNYAKPAEMQVEAKKIYANLGSPAVNPDPVRRDSTEPASAALPSRSAAQMPTAQKVASLGPSGSQNASLNAYVPPEQTRVAYDAPAIAEQPKSIGKRKYVDETVYNGLGKPEALLEALRHMGANAQKLGLPASLWCADFMNMVLRKTGIEATGSRAARSYLQYGKKIDEPRVGAIAIFTRGKNGGHIGIVRGTDGKGNPIIVSGNHNNIVAEALYPKERVLAYVVPRDTAH